MKDCFWSIYNTVDDTRVDGLKTIQLRSLMRTIARGSLDEWLVWEENTPEWRRASEVLHLFQSDNTLPGMSPTPPPIEGETKTIPSTTQTKTEKLEPKSMLFHETDQHETPKEKGRTDERANPRFLIALKVFINVEGRVITNTTVNVSVGGMKLRHPLPRDLAGSFDVTMIRGNVELSMRCRAMKNDQETETTRLLIEHCNRLDVLRTWLVRDSNEAAG